MNAPPGSTLVSAQLPATFRQSDSYQRPIKIVPRGLRSFDEHDADFFLELLPGPRDRDGLPDSIQFWKRKIEQIDPDLTFKVGLIYGPSGCGKSSLVRAGLMPRLGKHVLPVYIEATADETEARLTKGLRKFCRDLPDNLGLVDSLAKLRHGSSHATRRKVCLVLDQFEQWLFAKRGEENTELVAALRQCDGEHVQAIVMVRDDFWLAASRFMRDLEIRLVEGENSAAGGSLRSPPCQEGSDGVRTCLRGLAGNRRRSQQRSRFISGSIDFRARPGWEDHLGSVVSLRRDGQRKTLDLSHPQRGWWDRGNRIDVPRRDLQPPRLPLPNIAFTRRQSRRC